MKKQQNSADYKMADYITRENTEQISAHLANAYIDNYRVEKGNTNNKSSLKFPIRYTDKYFDNREQISRDKSRQSEESRVSAIKVYEANGHFGGKQIERLTFGPAKFKGHHLEKKHNSDLLMPITHNNQGQSRVSQKSISPKKQKISRIISQELGISQDQVQCMKEDTLNYELEKFVKKKGLQYLQENREKSYRRVNTEPTSEPKMISNPQQDISKDKRRKKLQKYPNYIQQVFSNLKPKPNIVKQQNTHNKLVQKKQNPSLINKSKQTKINHLNDREEMLGKIVYDKVQNFFNLDKKADYFSRVKSQQMIDQAWLQYLRTKMDRADLMLNKK